MPDLQIPYEDKVSLAAVEAYMQDVSDSDHPWDGWLQIGDFLDLNELSRYNVGEESSLEDLAESYSAGNEILDRHQKIIKSGNKKAQFILLEGNHDFRAMDAWRKDENKKFRSILEYDKQLKLKERKIKWVRSWSDGEMYKIGKAYFRHGLYTNSYHAKKMVERHGVNIFYGHTHDIMEMPIVHMGKDKTLAGKSLGCLCEYAQKYMKGAPSNWQQAISTFYFFKDRFFQEQTYKIFNHRFYAPDTGKIYDGKKL